MAFLDHPEQIKELRAEAERNNPLLKLSLGDLVRKMSLLAYENPDVFKSREEITDGSMHDYNLYQSLIHELGMREEKYTRVPLSEMRY